jgi:hypothetical protein
MGVAAQIVQHILGTTEGAFQVAVVGNRGPMGTARALIEMAAQCRGAAARNGQKHFEMPVYPGAYPD